MKTVCVYHAGCPDGVTAFWVVKRKISDVEGYPASHTEAPDLERLRDANVVIVDFSWKRAQIEEVYKVAAFVTILDHHKTAAEDLKDIGLPGIHFDMTKSGAGMAWDYFFPEQRRPRFIDYIEDRDLWAFKYPETNPFYLGMGQFDVSDGSRQKIYDDLMDGLVHTEASVINEGVAILKYQNMLIDNLISKRFKVRLMAPDVWKPSINLPKGGIWISGPSWETYAVSCPIMAISSDAGERLCEFGPFGINYWWDAKRRVWQFSLRSVGDFDVSEIAKLFKGGGHMHASGFAVQLLNGTLAIP